MIMGIIGVSLCLLAFFGIGNMQQKVDELEKKVIELSNKLAFIFGDETNAKKQIESQKAEIERLKRESDALKDREIERLRKELKGK